MVVFCVVNATHMVPSLEMISYTQNQQTCLINCFQLSSGQKLSEHTSKNCASPVAKDCIPNLAHL